MKKAILLSILAIFVTSCKTVKQATQTDTLETVTIETLEGNVETISTQTIVNEQNNIDEY
jgi:uncharacterized protein YoxC